MPTLLETQVRVIDALLQPDDGTAPALLRPRAPIDAARRLQIHRNNLQQSLAAALAAAYPVVAQLVGEAFFAGMARQYVRRHPSRSGSLQAFGGELPAFLRDFEPAAGLPYLPDVAALEWALHEVYHDAELPSLAPARLGEVPPERQAGLRLVRQPASRLLESRYPVLRIWQAHQPGTADDGMPISLDEGGVWLLVVQRALEIEFRPLGAGEHAWLRAFERGAGLGDATGAALRAEPAFDLGACLARHLALGLFTGLEEGP